MEGVLVLIRWWDDRGPGTRARQEPVQDLNEESCEVMARLVVRARVIRSTVST